VTRDESKRLAVMVGALAESFGKVASAPMLRGYEMGLSDLPIDLVEQAALRAMRESRFMPTIAELRELAGIPNRAAQAALAFATFERAVMRHGGYASVNFQDQRINATVRMLGGWERCCEMPADEFDRWLRKDFERIYSGLCLAGRAPIESPCLGIHAREAALHGGAPSDAAVIRCDYLPEPMARIEGTT